MSAFLKVGKASASATAKAATSAFKSVGKELATNALVQTLSGKKGRINYSKLARTPSPSISPTPSISPSSYLKPVTPIYSRSSSITSLNNFNNNNEYNNTNDTIFKPQATYGKPIKPNRNTLYGGKSKTIRKSKKSRKTRKASRKQK